MSSSDTEPVQASPGVALGLSPIECPDVTFDPPVADKDALVQEASARAWGLLSVQERGLIETWLSMWGDIDIDPVSIDAGPVFSRKELVSFVAQKIASAVRKKTKEVDPYGKLHEVLSSQLGSQTVTRSENWLTRLGKWVAGQTAGRLKTWLTPPDVAEDFGLTEKERAAASSVGVAVEQVVSNYVPASNEQVTPKTAMHLMEGFEAFGAPYGIKISHVSGLPSIFEDRTDFTSIKHQEPDGGVKGWYFKKAIIHEVVHVMHMMQARATAVRQVMATRGTSSIQQLTSDDLKAIQTRVNAFERKDNYAQLEKLATYVGGAGGRIKISESEYRNRLNDGSNQLTQAFQNDTLSFDYDKRNAGMLLAELGAALGQSGGEFFMNLVAVPIGALLLSMGKISQLPGFNEHAMSITLGGMLLMATAWNLMRQRKTGNAIAYIPRKLWEFLR